MGYRCPVCADPQADDVHLANHLAFTALVRGGDHESWLDEQVPDWEQTGESGLAERVREHADRVEYQTVFEDTTESAHDHREGGHAHAESDTDRVAEPADEGSPFPEIADGESTAETGAVLERARELTRQRRANAVDDPESDGDDQ